MLRASDMAGVWRGSSDSMMSDPQRVHAYAVPTNGVVVGPRFSY